MTPWWDDLGDDELAARLDGHGVDRQTTRDLVDRRDDPLARGEIARVLGP